MISSFARISVSAVLVAFLASCGGKGKDEKKTGSADHGSGKSGIQQGSELDNPDSWAFLPDTVAVIDGKNLAKKEFIEYINGSVGEQEKMFLTPSVLERIAPQYLESYVNEKVLFSMIEAAGIKGVTGVYGEKTVRQAVEDYLAKK